MTGIQEEQAPPLDKKAPDVTSSERSCAIGDFPVIEGVSKRFGDNLVLDDISLCLTGGGINCLLGPSGCGKSTLLRIAAGLMAPDSGRLLQSPEHSAVVFQEPRLLPWLTVAENLALALNADEKRRKREAVAEALALVHLSDTEQRMPRELSGGMAQRVGIARALLRRPSFLLMDEPFAALDAITRADQQSMLKALIKRQGVTCLFVTHDLGEALAIADRILVLKEGRVRLEYRNTKADAERIRHAVMRQLHTQTGAMSPEGTS